MRQRECAPEGIFSTGTSGIFSAGTSGLLCGSGTGGRDPQSSDGGFAKNLAPIIREIQSSGVASHLHARSTLAVWLPLVEAPGNSAFGPLDLHFQKFLKPACLLGQKFFELLSLV
jgi:hypothetical protein